jgi:hypothetical protein
LRRAFLFARAYSAGFFRATGAGRRSPATGGDVGLSRTARDGGFAAARRRGAPRHPWGACAQIRFLSLPFQRASGTTCLPVPERERKLQRESKAQGAFYKDAPLTPPKLGGLVRWGLSVVSIVSAPTSLIASCLRVTKCGAANQRDKGMLHTSYWHPRPVPWQWDVRTIELKSETCAEITRLCHSSNRVPRPVPLYIS